MWRVFLDFQAPSSPLCGLSRPALLLFLFFFPGICQGGCRDIATVSITVAPLRPAPATPLTVRLLIPSPKKDQFLEVLGGGELLPHDSRGGTVMLISGRTYHGIWLTPTPLSIGMFQVSEERYRSDGVISYLGIYPEPPLTAVSRGRPSVRRNRKGDARRPGALLKPNITGVSYPSRHHILYAARYRHSNSRDATQDHR
jgi:hypothetical protein